MPEFSYQYNDILGRNLEQQRTGVAPGTVVSIPKNWDDKTAFYYDNLAEYDKRAYETALMNYQNKYNSPLEQMKRYQEAGLNPFDALGKTANSVGQAPAGAVRANSSKAQVNAQRLQFAANMIGTIFDVVSGVAGIKKQLQQIKYNDEAFPIMLNQLRYRTSNESLRGFLSELGLNSGTVGLAKQAYDMGIPLNYLPWFTHGPQVYGSSIGFNFDNLDKFNELLNQSPYAKAFSELINLRRAQGGNVRADRALKQAVKALNESKRQSEEVKQQRDAFDALLKQWELEAKDITGYQSLDKFIWQLLR